MYPVQNTPSEALLMAQSASRKAFKENIEYKNEKVYKACLKE